MQRHLRLAGSCSELDQAHSAKADHSAETPIRIVLADDHRSIRRTLRALLDAEGEIEVIAEVADVDTATRHVRQRRPHVLIIDLRLANGSALATLAELRRSAPDTQIVVMTMEASRSVAAQVLGAGALGYVLKEQSDRDLLPAVRAAARSESYVSPELTAVLARC
jgi:DNA-binding NarL/FixJ family response regulator